MFNLGWFGQKNRFGGGRVSAATAIARFLRAGATDFYTADEVFLTDVWVPALRDAQAAGRIARLPSHPYRRAAPPRRPAAYRQFLRRPLPPPGSLTHHDSQVMIE